MKKRIIALLCLIIAGSLGWGMTGSPGGGMVCSAAERTDASRYAAGRTTADRYTAGDADIKDLVKEISVDWAAGTVIVETGETNAVLIREACEEALPEEKQVHWWLDKTTLRIVYDMTDGWSIYTAQKNLTITLPSDLVLQDLEISTGAADVTVNEVTARQIEIESASGSVNGTLKGDLKDADITTASGNITVVFRGGVSELDAESVSGDMELSAAGMITNADLASTSGNIHSVFQNVPKNLEMETVSGDMILSVPEDADFTLQFESLSGKFNSAVPMTQSGGRYTAGSGTNTVEIETVAGDVTVEIQKIPQN